MSPANRTYIFVVAGSYEQFRAWMRENPDKSKDAIYPFSKASVAGRFASEIVLYGKYKNNYLWRDQDSWAWLLGRVAK